MNNLTKDIRSILLVGSLALIASSPTVSAEDINQIPFNGLNGLANGLDLDSLRDFNKGSILKLTELVDINDLKALAGHINNGDLNHLSHIRNLKSLADTDFTTLVGLIDFVKISGLTIDQIKALIKSGPNPVTAITNIIMSNPRGLAASRLVMSDPRGAKLVKQVLLNRDFFGTNFAVKAFFGDTEQDRVVAIDVSNMTFSEGISTEGVDPYPVDPVGNLGKVYAVTRGSNSMDIIDSTTYEKMGLIELDHYPRSAEAYNPELGLQLVSGADKPMISVIDVFSDTVVATVGENKTYGYQSGNDTASGHPFWFSKTKFALIDRPNKIIHVYRIRQDSNKNWVTQKVSSVETPTSVHHLVQAGGKNMFFALAEGSDQMAPALIKYKMDTTGALIEEGKVMLSDAMGSAHHANLHPDETHFYIGSTDGYIHVVNIATMEVEKTIQAGMGAAHVTFAPKRNLAIVTNHDDTFVTVIDTKTHTFVKNIEVSGPQIKGAQLQSHTSFVHPNGDSFHAFATDNGIFYKIDLNTLKVTDTLKTGGTPLQGVFLCDNQKCSGMY